MSEEGHRYTFGFSRSGECSYCGSQEHWSLHCPDKPAPS